MPNKWSYEVFRSHEDTLRTHHVTAMKIIREYAGLFNVRIQRVSENQFFEKVRMNFEHGEIEQHPSGDIAFSKAHRAVLHVGPTREHLMLLPHEITHVMWPGTMPEDPENEWSFGMIPYELAWMKKLCREKGKKGIQCLDAWSYYAHEGAPMEEDMHIMMEKSKDITQKHQLPNPWISTEDISP